MTLSAKQNAKYNLNVFRCGWVVSCPTIWSLYWPCIGSLYWSSQHPINRETGYSNVLGGWVGEWVGAPNVRQLKVGKILMRVQWCMYRPAGIQMTMLVLSRSRQHEPPVSVSASSSEKPPSPFFCCYTCTNTKLNRYRSKHNNNQVHSNVFLVHIWYAASSNQNSWTLPLLENLLDLRSLLLLPLLQSSLLLFHTAWESLNPVFFPSQTSCSCLFCWIHRTNDIL